MQSKAKQINLKEKINNYLQRTGFEAFAPKAVLFDMDGVLINSMPNHEIAWQQSMALFGIHMCAVDAYATEGARGVDTIREMVRLQQGRIIDEEEAQRMYDEKARIFAELPKAEIMTGIPQLLELISRSGVIIGVVTGSGQRPLIRRLTNDFSPYIVRERIVTAYDVKRGKPNPDPYLMGMRKCGVNPWQTIVVENAPLGVRAGVAAKAFTIGVNTGPLPDSQLIEAGADWLCHSMKDISDQWPTLIGIDASRF